MRIQKRSVKKNTTLLSNALVLGTVELPGGRQRTTTTEREEKGVEECALVELFSGSEFDLRVKRKRAYFLAGGKQA
jgi:hypothetical protein